METFLCKLIADGVVSSIKIHRPSRVIHLRPKRFSIDILDEVSYIYICLQMCNKFIKFSGDRMFENSRTLSTGFVRFLDLGTKFIPFITRSLI